MKTTFFPAAWFGALLMICGAAVAATNSAAPGPNEKTKTCFQCSGTGKTKCTVTGCVNGQADCPGPCMKLSKGSWIHMNVAGHDPKELWQKFPTAKGGYQAWTSAHVGEVIQMQNGEPVNIGKCSICSGAARVQCSVCKGTSVAVCGLCDGKKAVPESWTTFDNPKMKNRPTRYKLKDGRVLVGRKVMALGSRVTIRTEKGDESVEAADIVSEEKPATTK